jgi:Mg/Co/Ni transporter MgtE
MTHNGGYERWESMQALITDRDMLELANSLVGRSDASLRAALGRLRPRERIRALLATVVDVTGIVIYLSVGRAVLGAAAADVSLG